MKRDGWLFYVSLAWLAILVIVFADVLLR